MFQFLFGLAWSALITPIFVVCLVIPGAERGGADMSPLLFIFLLIFELIGLVMLILGLRKIIRDIKTKMHGVPCYGLVCDIGCTGASMNDNPEFKAIMTIINPETNQLETIDEIIGFDDDKYPINSYVLCKYYKGDINLGNIVNENEVPGDIKKRLVPRHQTPNYSNLEFSEDREYVTIDGVQYKKNQ